MASLTATLPSTPQAYSRSMAPAPSPPQSQTHTMPPYPPPGYSSSFDGSQQAVMSQPLPANYSQSFSNGPVSNPGYSRSFGDGAYMAGRGYEEKPQIYTAIYSGVSVYEMEVGGIACMRRRSDGWLNATQILKVAGVDKGKRTKVLEKEILTGEHEKVQGGYGKYQGTWISYRRGREFCRQYGVEDALRPLLDYDVSADGTSGQGQDTPTKEQAMAANRKRFYNANLDPRPPGPSAANGTFFSSISPTTSVALAAMNKAARLNSPAPRPPSAQRPANISRPSQQDGLASGSQQSAVSEMDTKPDSGYGTQPNGEPPRKRMRPDSQEGMGPPSLPFDTSMRSASPTEPNESFLYDAALMHDSVNSAGEPVALPPLPSPATEEQQEKMNLILDLFAEQARTDYTSHAALTQLSGEDLNMPLDASANSALHWAATLAKVPLLKLLIQKGASIWRGNAAGQSALISAVLVNNCWEHSCFPELLELLAPLIEVRDLQGRTILHHIAVSSGIKGRAPSSKYYLEALLEFLVRIGTQSSSAVAGHGAATLAVAAAANLQLASQQTNGETLGQDAGASGFGQKGPVSLVRFLSHIVNARDKAGNTALNLVARIGNRSIIQQLLEIHADPSLPNNKGVSAKDFGVGSEPNETPRQNGHHSSQTPGHIGMNNFGSQEVARDVGDAAVVTAGSQVEDLGQDVIASLTSMLTQNLASHKDLVKAKTAEVDHINEQIRELSSMQKANTEKLEQVKDRVKVRAERQAKVANLRRELERKRREAKHATLARGAAEPGASSSPHPDPEWLQDSTFQVIATAATPDGAPDAVQRQILETLVPAPAALRARARALGAHNAALLQHAAQLRSRSTELEALYRKVVAICTCVPEDKVEEALPALIAAVESERGGLGEVGRVREFLRRVDGAPVPHPALTVNPTIAAAAAAAAAGMVEG